MKIRPLTEADLPALAALAAADEERLLDRPSHISAEEVRGWLSRVDLERDSWRFEDGGEIAAIGWFSPYGEVGVGTGIVAEGWKGRGLGSDIVARIEAAGARENCVRLHVFSLVADDAAAKLFVKRGYREVRRFYEMVIDLDTRPEPPSIPVETFREADAQAFHAALTESFQDHWEHHADPFDEWWERHRSSPAYDPSVWFLIRDGDEIAGIARNEPRGYVGALGVRRPYRGRGYAKALLFQTFSAFYDRGVRRVSLGVDAENPTGATHLYEAVGMSIETEMATYEKQLA